MGGAWKMSLNDVCCFVPAWFGSSATLFLGLLAGECSMSSTATVVASGIMAVIPAHIMRSVGGGYDNESIALTAMCMTFYFWIRSLRAPYSTFFAVLAGMAYVYMVRASFTFSPPLPRGPRASRAVLFSDQLSFRVLFFPCPTATCTGCGLGWIRLRHQHGRSPRRHPRAPGLLQPNHIHRLHALLPHRYLRGHPRACGRLGAAQVPRAARILRRLPGLPGHPALRDDCPPQGNHQAPRQVETSHPGAFLIPACLPACLPSSASACHLPPAPTQA